MEVIAALPDARLRNVVILYSCSLQNSVEVAHQWQSGKLLSL